jgi:hypothetical protein
MYTGSGLVGVYRRDSRYGRREVWHLELLHAGARTTNLPMRKKLAGVLHNYIRHEGGYICTKSA